MFCSWPLGLALGAEDGKTTTVESTVVLLDLRTRIW